MQDCEIKNEKTCQIQDLGKIRYLDAYRLQQKYLDAVIKGASPRLLICEHPSVITLGRVAQKENILYPLEQIKDKGIEIFSVDRGGDVTMHCEGQLILYPILNLRNYGHDLKKYLYQLEEVGIDFLKSFGIVGCRFVGKTGVWVGNKKIISIGIGVKKWISYHGMSININPDLSLFSLIKSCGLDARLTSVEEIKGIKVDNRLTKERLIEAFCRIFDLEGYWVDCKHPAL